MEKSNATKQASEESKRRGDRGLKKINDVVKETIEKNNQVQQYKKIRLLFQDEAGFGRINKPKYCWCKKGVRPSVPCHDIREYRYAYGAVEPLTGESFFLVMPYCNTDCMNVYLSELSQAYHEDQLIIVCDGGVWHKSKTLEVPKNIKIVHLPPYTPEMNPIEQIWKQIRQMGFKNEIFHSLNDVIHRLCDKINTLSKEMIQSITSRNWILNI